MNNRHSLFITLLFVFLTGALTSTNATETTAVRKSTPTNLKVQAAAPITQLSQASVSSRVGTYTQAFDTLDIDGAWCWFNDPRAIHYKGQKDQTYIGWVSSKGDIVIASYDHQSGHIQKKVLHASYEPDDHDNPGIFIRKDGRIVVFYSKHSTEPAHRLISTNPEDISSWGEDYQFGQRVTYPSPFQCGDSILVFYRGIKWHPTVAVSTDNGQSFQKSMQLISGGGDRPYARYSQDKKGAIHIAFTTGHPRNEAHNQVFYVKFQHGNFYRADGSFIQSFNHGATPLNVDSCRTDLVYNARFLGKGWIWDLTTDTMNRPVMVFASFPNDSLHLYHYARWTGKEWYSTVLTDAGPWFPQTPAGTVELEPNYSGGISLDPNNPSQVYLSRKIKNSFEIFSYKTCDGGISWKSEALTHDTPEGLVNVRPIVPRNHVTGKFDVIWMRGSYQHYYAKYKTSLVYFSE